MFAKLFARITESSLMEEDIPVRYTFVMLLAIADAEGDVIGTDVAIARRLNMPLEEFQRCVAVLGAADPSSNSKDMDGRRVIQGDSERGYKIVNYVKYRSLTTEFQKKTYMRNYMREYREKGKVKNDVKLTESNGKSPPNVLTARCLTSASASASNSERKGSAEGKGKKKFPSEAKAALVIINSKIERIKEFGMRDGDNKLLEPDRSELAELKRLKAENERIVCEV